MALIRDTKVLFVFDNVDHYIDLETENIAIGSPEMYSFARFWSLRRIREQFSPVGRLSLMTTVLR